MNWWQRLWKRRQLEDQLDCELRFHFECRVADRIRDGMTPEDARRNTRLELGALEQTKEYCRDARGTRWVETALQDIRFAARTLRKSPAFTAVAVLTLALGIGANTAVFTIVNGVLLRPLPFPDPNKLFSVSYLPEHGPFFFQRPGLIDRHYLEFRRQNQIFEQVTTFGINPVTLTGAGEPIRLPAANVTPDFFGVFRVNLSLGRTFLPEEDQVGRDDVVILSDKLWRSRFAADPRILGRTILLEGVGYTVVGVAPVGFQFPEDVELWTPLEVRLNPHNTTLRTVIGRLKPGISPRQAQAEFETFAHYLPVERKQDTVDMAARLIPLKELVVGKTRQSLLIFAGAVAFVLLIACANVANLLLIRTTARAQEISVRAALGAGRWRLIHQLLTESSLVSLAGGVLGIVLALVSVPVLLVIAPVGKIPRIEEIRLDAGVLAFTVCLSVLTGILFGLGPAFQATGWKLRDSLSRGGRSATGRHGGLRHGLVVAEIALALVLFAGASLMLKSFLRMRAVNPGFHSENVLTVTVDLPESTYRTAAQIQEFHKRTLDKLSRLPGVLAAGAVNWLPFNQYLVRGDFQIENGRRLPPHYMVDKPSVSPNYFQTLGIRLLNGRTFNERDNTVAPGVVIVSESVARLLWPGENPVGQRISMADHPKPDDWLTIVGVVDDVRQQDLTDRPHPAIYQPYLQVSGLFFLSHMTFVVRTASYPENIASAMRRVLRDVDPNQPVQSISTMANLIAMNTAEPQFQMRLLSVFAMVALALAAIGIYGVLAYSVAERTREIGIRMALGAGKGNVMNEVLRTSLLLAGAGVVLGTAGALAVTRVLENYLFEVKPSDPAIFLAVAVLFIAVALLAGWGPALRATRVDPVIALRFE